MGFNRFGLLIALRLTGLLSALALTGYLLFTVHYPMATVLCLLVSIALAVEVFRFVRKTNLEVARFLDAARYADFGQRFEFSSLGAGFAELGETFTAILDRFRADRAEHETQLRQLKAILEHVPIPLITVQADNLVLQNNAARRLFSASRVEKVDDLKAYGADLPVRLSALIPGQRALVPFTVDDVEQTFAVVGSELTVGQQREQLISLFNIQSELDGVQIEAWQDLVRVLTHEIMNSITPVASLARTAADLMDDVSNRLQDQPAVRNELDDIRDAISTVARRSDGLMEFVTSYRQLTQLPEPQKSTLPVGELLADVARLASADWSAEGPELTLSTQPESLALNADRQMITQVLINLLSNAAHASPARGTIALNARLSSRGGVVIEVEDQGPGISEDVAARMFVPFYTTRKDGSGVGLAFSRQVMIAHGGSISFTNLSGPSGVSGARFTLNF